MDRKEFYKAFETLTEKTKSVLMLMLLGKTDREIAKSLDIAEGTVRKHIQNIIEHFGIDSDKYLPGQRSSRRGELIELCKNYNLGFSDFYIERVPYESQCYEEILKPGCLIRIKAPQQMGKTSLLEKILSKARDSGYQTLTIDFQLADSTVLTDYEKLLQWFCANASDSLELTDRVDEYWKDMYGLNKNCTRYFQKYLLTETNSPLALGLDNVDLVFEQTNVFTDFCRLIRGWYDMARQGDRIGEIWREIRLIVVHSTEIYRMMDINSSPLAGVGLTIELPEFTLLQVQALAQRHGLHWNTSQVEQLMAMVEGHPALIQQTIEFVKRQSITLEELLETAPTEEGVFSNHLRRHLQNLRQNLELAEAFSLCVHSTEPVELAPESAFKLHSMGLVKFRGNCVTSRCNLYRQYFRIHLNS
ncbi:MAG TPA: AAA-like domain-containing protein [Allocoleopsis sp.]